ncbi:MAG: hypothetical protein EOP22_19670 [Hyphomicrobiales bacterium]|nr:MAG: hypothetical protein EOP22_19670 [Hyphomicrobiales bacterium]
MKAGVVTSVVAHATLLILAVAGLSAATPLEPQVVESIAVDLVPISEVTNIRMGSLDSTVVETETPAIVETETPAELAQPTGNTQEDQPTPTETAVETPAPVVNTAPEPVPEPTPEPEPTPVVEEAPPPEPTPVAEPEPAPVEEAPPPEVVAETPAEVAPEKAAAPMPMMRSAAVMRAPSPKKPEPVKVAEAKPAEKTPPAKTETPKPTQKKPADTAAKPADEVANLINNENSRGATTGQGGQQTLGRNDGRSSTLSQSQIDGLIAQIKNCQYYSPPAGAAEAGATAQLRFNIDAGGNVPSPPQIVSSGSSQLEVALARAAQRAVQRCGPYAMATGQEVQAVFDPRLM